MADRRTIQYVPALPGWSVVTLIEEKEAGYLAYDPIIAWEMRFSEWEDQHDTTHHTREVNPITVSGCPDELNNVWGVLRSDGKFEIPEGAEFDSSHQLLSALKEAAAERDRIKKTLSRMGTKPR